MGLIRPNGHLTEIDPAAGELGVAEVDRAAGELSAGDVTFP
jgi:hypothetical protein